VTPDSEAILAALRELKPVLQKEMGITRLRVFGSVGRGEAGPDSDVDIIADFAETPGLFKLFDVREYIEKALGKDVDLLTEGGIDKYIKKRVLREAVDVA
jgi:predicted nucleotidyltransferase